MARPPSLTLPLQTTPCSWRYHKASVQLSPSTATGGKLAHTCELWTSTTLRYASPRWLLYCSSNASTRPCPDTCCSSHPCARWPALRTIAVIVPRLTRLSQQHGQAPLNPPIAGMPFYQQR